MAKQFLESARLLNTLTIFLMFQCNVCFADTYQLFTHCIRLNVKVYVYAMNACPGVQI